MDENSFILTWDSLLSSLSEDESSVFCPESMKSTYANKNDNFSKDEALGKSNEDLDYEYALKLQMLDDETSKESKINKDDSLHRNNDLDYEYALKLQMEEEEAYNESKNNEKPAKESLKTSKPLSIVDKQWELIDPNPDVHALFMEFDAKFFYGKLQGVEVRWSPRMTLCAGVCCYEGRGGLCSVRLSLPLLKLRPRRDLVETLLHEMIHAYLFVTCNNKDRTGHGPQFLSHMNRINKESGTRITVYHSFHDEVDLYKKHWWKCDGPCQEKHPFYGFVKRAMNRAPGPNDVWWSAHQASCGGKFVKVKEPDDYKKAGAKRKIADAKDSKSTDIRGFFKDKNPEYVDNKGANQPSSSSETSNMSTLKSLLPAYDSLERDSARVSSKTNFVPFQGSGHKLGGSYKKFCVSPYVSFDDFKRANSVQNDGHSSSSSSTISSNSISFLSTPGKSNVLTSSDLTKDSIVQSSAASSGARKLIQSPMDKFLILNSSRNSGALPKRSPTCLNEFKEDRTVDCPICFQSVKASEINVHLDLLHC